MTKIFNLKYSALILILCISFKIANGQTSGYIVTINKWGSRASDMAYLTYQVEGEKITDSVFMKNGFYTFRGKISEPTSAMVNIGTRRGSPVLLYLEPGVINIDADEPSKVKGGNLNQDFAILKNRLKDCTVEENEISAYFKANSSQFQQDHEMMKNFMVRLDKWKLKKRNIQLQFVKDYPSSLVSLYTIKELLGNSLDLNKIDSLFSFLSIDVRNSEPAKKYIARIAPLRSLKVGFKAPDFTQNDTNGQPVSLSDFRGKYVLLDFWASWCGPCRAENPHVVKAYKQFKDRGFTVLGVSLDNANGKEAWIKAINEDGLTWTHVSDLNHWKNAVAKQYFINSIPQNYLIDRNGIIVGVNLRGEALLNALKKIFNN